MAKCGSCKQVIAVPATSESNRQPAATPQPQPARPPAAPQPVANAPQPGSEIVFNCPNCGTLSRVDSAYAGRQGRCPPCQGLFEIPLQSTADSSGQLLAPSAAPTPAAAPALDLAPEPALDLAPDPEEQSTSRRKPARKGKASKRGRKGRKASPDEPPVELADCFFCFEPIPANAEACPKCGQDLQPAAPAGRGSRSRVRSGPLGPVRVFRALMDGISDFSRNALFCLLAVLIFQVLVAVVGVVTGISAVVVAGKIGSLPGAITVGVAALGVTLVAVAYLLQGLFAFWLACARRKGVSLRLLFSSSLAGGISGFAVQVALAVAYVGVTFGVSFFMNKVGSLIGTLVGVLLFFAVCCLLLLIGGLAQIYIVDQELGFMEALASASRAVASAKAKLLGYAAICLGTLLLVTAVVSLVLTLSGIAPSPENPSIGKLLVSAVIESGVSLTLLSVMGTSLTRVYIQLIGR